MACLLSALVSALTDGVMSNRPWSRRSHAANGCAGAGPVKATPDELHRVHFACPTQHPPSSPPAPPREYEAVKKLDATCTPSQHLASAPRSAMPEHAEGCDARPSEHRQPPGSASSSSSTRGTAPSIIERGRPESKAEGHAIHPLSRPTAPLVHHCPVTAADLLARRRRVMSKAQSVSYENTDPLLITRGHGQFLVDVEGRCFLDTRNNVCHVGHANAQVVKAVSTQMAALNTNTRYLHPYVVTLAEQLLATFPPPLRDGVVFFVNSGSEANDLALRLARCYTGCTESIAVDHGYHGHTCAVIACSPYKCKHPRFCEPTAGSATTHIVPAPDMYRLHPSIKKALWATRNHAQRQRHHHCRDPATKTHAPVSLRQGVPTSDSVLLLRASSQSSNESGDGAEANRAGEWEAQVPLGSSATGRAGGTATKQAGKAAEPGGEGERGGGEEEEQEQEQEQEQEGNGSEHEVGKDGEQVNLQVGKETAFDSDSGHSSTATSTHRRTDTLTSEGRSLEGPSISPPPAATAHDEEALVGTLYAEHVEAVARRRKGKLACMLVESGMSVAGVLLPPRGYLQRCFSAVRAAGGVCIVDEVQTGFGRLGSSYWGFQANSSSSSSSKTGNEDNSACGNSSDSSALRSSGNGVRDDDARAGKSGGDGRSDDGMAVPDVVTMGKPFGNGMPLAAVVCRREIAAAFEQGPEYFNTFGGNPVCCAAGLAVMDEMRSLNLMGRATHVGGALRAALVRLQRRLQHGYGQGDMEAALSCECGDGVNAANGTTHVPRAEARVQGTEDVPQHPRHAQQQQQQQQKQRPGLCFIGDVRGEGLFLGVDFVMDEETRVPATRAASFICSHLKNEHKILTSLDGPGDNVMVIKPPMVFTLADAHRLARALECAVRACWQLTLKDWDAIGATPT